MECTTRVRRTGAGWRLAAVCALLTSALTACGCAAHRTQLTDAVVADEALARQALEALAGHPLPAERAAQLAIERQGEAFVALGYFSATPPERFHAEIVTPIGVTLIEIRRDGDGAEVISGSGPLQRMLTMGRFSRLLGLWLIGDCAAGQVLHGANGVVVDCPATGPDEGATWRLWIDPATGARGRGELLQGGRRVADFTCDAGGTCVLQDLVYRYAVRVLPLADGG